MTDQDQDRAEFEAWAEVKLQGSTERILAWMGFQAARQKPNKHLDELLAAVEKYRACRHDFQATNRGSWEWDQAGDRLEEASIVLDEAIARIRAERGRASRQRCGRPALGGGWHRPMTSMHTLGIPASTPVRPRPAALTKGTTMIDLTDDRIDELTKAINSLQGYDSESRDLLAILRERRELPWRVTAPGVGVVGVFRRREDAALFANRTEFVEALITGLDDEGETPTVGERIVRGIAPGEPGCPPARLAEPRIAFRPYTPERPTLDDVDERRPKVCYRDGQDKLRVLCRVGPSAYELDDRGEPLSSPIVMDEPSEWYLFDTDPPTPKTLADVPEGVWCEVKDKDGERRIAWRDGSNVVYDLEDGWDCVDVAIAGVYNIPGDIPITRVLGYPQVQCQDEGDGLFTTAARIRAERGEG